MGLSPFLVPISLFICIAATLIGVPIARAYGRRIEAKGTDDLSRDVMARLERMEQAIDSIAVEVERISEGQRFVTKIFTERPAANPAPAQRGGLDDAKAPLALGAGPMEPIRVAERQGVKQMNTPH